MESGSRTLQAGNIKNITRNSITSDSIMYETKFHTEDLSDKSFLVTGGAGFIGSNIVEYLLKHHAGKVRVIDNLITGSIHNVEEFKEYPNFEFIEGDIRDLIICKEVCQDIDYVLHQAALGSVPRSLKEPEVTNSINVDGFVNMLIAAKSHEALVLWYFTPMALAFTSHVACDVCVYDRIGDRANRIDPPAEFSDWEDKLLARADVVLRNGEEIAEDMPQPDVRHSGNTDRARILEASLK